MWNCQNLRAVRNKRADCVIYSVFGFFPIGMIKTIVTECGFFGFVLDHILSVQTVAEGFFNLPAISSFFFIKHWTAFSGAAEEFVTFLTHAPPRPVCLNLNNNRKDGLTSA